MPRNAEGGMTLTIFFRIVLGLAVVLLPLGGRCLAGENGVISRIIETEKTDFGNFYLDRGNLTRLGIGSLPIRTIRTS
jgi:hypothetical protein